MRQKSSEGMVVSYSCGYFEFSVDSVVGPKLLERVVMPNSYWRARVRAYMVFQPV